MKICLLNKNWIEQKREMETRREMTTLDGREISENLNLIRQKRPDIFDEPEGEAPPPPEPEQAWPQKQQFDGFHPNLSRTTANLFMINQGSKQASLQESNLNPDAKEKQAMRRAYP